MIKRLVLVVLFVASVLVSQSQDPIKEIRKLYYWTQEIRSSLKTQTLEILGESAEGGEYEVYSDSSSVKLVLAKYYGETGKAIYEVYFDQKELYFIHLQNYYYKYHVMDPKFRDDSLRLEEHRFYFWNDQMIRWVDPKGEFVDNESQQYIDKALGLRDWVDEFYYELVD